MQKAIIIIAITLFSIPPLQAQHYMGGEITWECVQTGNIRITMTLFDLCANTAQWGNSATLSTTLPIGSVTLTKASEIDISPTCNGETSFAHIACPNSQGTTIYGVKKIIYNSDVNYPNGLTLPVTAIPGSGIRLSWSNCCRTPADNAANMPSNSMFLHSVIYPPPKGYHGVCYDNSPKFMEEPPMHIASSTPYSRMLSAYDVDGDSLVYVWGKLYTNDASSWVSQYNTGYSFSSPLPGPAVNSGNSPVVLDSHSGRLSLNSGTQGYFFTNLQVRSYREGTLISVVNREMNIRIAATGLMNNAPVLSPIPQQILPDFYTDTLFAGDTARFTLSATDFDMLPNSQPQSLVITVSGTQVGLNGSNPNTGCLEPPCATFTPAPGSPTYFGASINMTWPITSAHTTPDTLDGNALLRHEYDFLFRIKDDYCPIPGERSVLYRVVAFDTMNLGVPTLNCSQILSNSMLHLYWDSLKDPYHRVVGCRLMASEFLAGPYTAIDTIQNLSKVDWLNILPDIAQRPYYLFLEYQTKYKTAYHAFASDTISTLLLRVDTPNTDGIARLRWNRPYHSKDNGSQLLYSIWRSDNSGWILLNSTTQTMYDDASANQGPWFYKISVANNMIDAAVACDFNSNVAAFVNTTGFEEEAEAVVIVPEVIQCGGSDQQPLSPRCTDGKPIDQWSIHIYDGLGRYLSPSAAGCWNPCDNPAIPEGIYFYEMTYVHKGKEGKLRGRFLLIK